MGKGRKSARRLSFLGVVSVSDSRLFQPILISFSGSCLSLGLHTRCSWQKWLLNLQPATLCGEWAIDSGSNLFLTSTRISRRSSCAFDALYQTKNFFMEQLEYFRVIFVIFSSIITNEVIERKKRKKKERVGINIFDEKVLRKDWNLRKNYFRSEKVLIKSIVRDANNILKAITSSCTPKRSRDLPGLEVSSSCISASLSASPISSRYLKREKGKKTIFKFNRYSSGNFFRLKKFL